MDNNDVQEKKNTFLSSPSPGINGFSSGPVLNPNVESHTTFVQPVQQPEPKVQTSSPSIFGIAPVANPVVQKKQEPVQPVQQPEPKVQTSSPSIFGIAPVVNPVVQKKQEPVQPVQQLEPKVQTSSPSIFGIAPVVNPVEQKTPQSTFVQQSSNIFVTAPVSVPVSRDTSVVQSPSIFGTQPKTSPVIEEKPKSENNTFLNTSSNEGIFTGFGATGPVKNDMSSLQKEEKKETTIISHSLPGMTTTSSEGKFVSNIGPAPVANTTIKPTEDFVSIFKTEPKVPVQEVKNDVDEKRQLPKPTTELPKSEKKQTDDSPQIIMTIEDLMRSSYSEKVELEKKTRKANKWFFRLSIASGVAFAAVLLFAIFGKTNVFNFIGSRVYYQDKKVTITGVNTTAVVVDNKYKVAFNDEEDQREQAKKYIVQDSENQKKKCSNDEVKKIESEIESEYGIVAVNLCEMDTDFAKEIKNMIGVVYKEFPMIKSELTNLTLNNMEDGTGVLAFFNPALKFADSNKLGGYPKIYKMMISLNSQFFLDESLSEIVRNSASSEYFPSGATRTTIVAHEFGHYLSFLAQLHNSDMDKLMLIIRKDYKSYVKVIEDSNEGVFSKKILEEALANYNEKYGNDFSDIEEFRSSISMYASAYDQTGTPIYDEAIAESFHDYYINRGNAKRASLEVMEVLKKYLTN